MDEIVYYGHRRGQCSAIDAPVAHPSFSCDVDKPVVREQANARERYRTHRYGSAVTSQPIESTKTISSNCNPCVSSVNSAFVTLRQLIPTEPKTRKLSKIETLRLAKSYIEHLAAILMTGEFQVQISMGREPEKDRERGRERKREREIERVRDRVRKSGIGFSPTMP